MKKLTLVLENVRSAFNVGAVFRTCDGLNCDIHLIGITPLPGKDKKLEKTSLSSLEFVDWKYFDTAQDWHKYILLTKEKGEKNVILSVEEGRDVPVVSLFDVEQKLSSISYDHVYIVLGHEINGVDPFVVNKSDFVVKIPMDGKKNSLNVSTCAGIVGYRVKEVLSK